MRPLSKLAVFFGAAVCVEAAAAPVCKDTNGALVAAQTAGMTDVTASAPSPLQRIVSCPLDLNVTKFTAKTPDQETVTGVFCNSPWNKSGSFDIKGR